MTNISLIAFGKFAVSMFKSILKLTFIIFQLIDIETIFCIFTILYHADIDTFYLLFVIYFLYLKAGICFEF